MLRLSKKADYALLACATWRPTPTGARIRRASWPRRTTFRPELLAKVLQKLVRARLLASHQGIHGGYGLSRPADTISVADVIQAIDGPLTVTACSDTDHSCDQYAKCNIRDPLWRIKDRIVSALAATSVADLAADMPVVPPAGRRRAGGGAAEVEVRG